MNPPPVKDWELRCPNDSTEPPVGNWKRCQRSPPTLISLLIWSLCALSRFQPRQQTSQFVQPIWKTVDPRRPRFKTRRLPPVHHPTGQAGEDPSVEIRKSVEISAFLDRAMAHESRGWRGRHQEKPDRRTEDSKREFASLLYQICIPSCIPSFCKPLIL